MIRIQGRDFEFHFSPLAVAELEERLDLSLGDLYARLRSGKVRMRDMLTIIWAGCLDAAPNLPLEAVSMAVEAGEPLLGKYREAVKVLTEDAFSILRMPEAEGEQAKN